ncbi:MAG: VanZ family protein [Eubacteriales bacterium]
MNRKTIIIILIAVILATVVFIFQNSLTSGESSSQKSGFISDIIQKIIDPQKKIDPDAFHIFIRKSAHILEFALLGIELIILTILIKPRFYIKLIFMPLFISLLTGVTDEYLQMFVTRTSSVSDVLIDFFGSVSGIAGTMLIYEMMKAIKIKRAKNLTKM